MKADAQHIQDVECVSQDEQLRFCIRPRRIAERVSHVYFTLWNEASLIQRWIGGCCGNQSVDMLQAERLESNVAARQCGHTREISQRGADTRAIVAPPRTATEHRGKKKSGLRRSLLFRRNYAATNLWLVEPETS